MFFILSKLFWAIAQPVNLIGIILLVGVIAGWFGRRRFLRSTATLAFIALALAAWTSLGALILSPLEERFQRPSPPPAKVDGIVVLGGGLEGAINLARGGYELNSGGDRFVETAVLARRYPEARIVVSGGVGTLLLEGESDAMSAQRLLTALGVDPERLILEAKSRNTYENAVFTSRMVKPKPGETWLLVTSAFHMPRAKALFDKAGFPMVPWPVDYRTSGREGISLFADNSVDALSNTTTAMREWIGLFAYWLAGRIPSPFPSAL
jgi:uncharacterized SAM-binding protein YcdF (DUF218 family)